MITRFLSTKQLRILSKRLALQLDGVAVPHVASVLSVVGIIGSSRTTPSHRAIDATAAENEEERDRAE